MGRYAGLGRSWWTPIRVSIVVGLLVYAVGWLSKGYCLANGWGAPQRYMYLCYSDIPILYSARGLADGAFPYLLDPGPGQQVLEYPVLTGVFMYVAAWVTRLLGGGGPTFFGVNVVGMSALLAWTIASTGLTVRRRPWDALMVALAPVVALAGFVNWDLLAIALTSASPGRVVPAAPGGGRHVAGPGCGGQVLPAGDRRPDRPALRPAGAVAGAGRVPRGGTRRRGWWSTCPVMLANFEGWSRFYTFSRERGMDFGSPVVRPHAGGHRHPGRRRELPGHRARSCWRAPAIAWLVLRAPQPPRLARPGVPDGRRVRPDEQGLLAAVRAVGPPAGGPGPAPVARPADLAGAESAYFVGIWWFLVGYGTQDKGLHEGWYVAATAAHWLATAWLMAMVAPRRVVAPATIPCAPTGSPRTSTTRAAVCWTRSPGGVPSPGRP